MDNHTEGKSLIFTDIHFGLKGNSISRLNIAVKAVKCILDAVKKHDIKNIFFGGDLLHERVSINVNTMNVVLKCVEAMAKHCKVWLIVGNHDTHYKNSVDVSSLNMFKHTDNVEVDKRFFLHHGLLTSQLSQLSSLTWLSATLTYLQSSCLRLTSRSILARQLLML